MIRTKRRLNELRADEDGSAVVLFAFSAPALLGLAAISVDLASLYLSERELQGLADAAAAAAVSVDIESQGRSAAELLIARRGLESQNIALYETGTYARDAAIAFDDRFSAGGSNVNAVRIRLSRVAPLFFASIFGRSDSTVAAEATAAKNDMVAFELGSKLLSLSSSLPNQFLSRLAGSELNLTDQDIARLAATQIDVVTLADRLRAEQGEPDRNFGETYDAVSGLVDIVEAMAAASPDSATSGMLLGIVASLSGEGIVMSELIDLGPLGLNDVDDGKAGIRVDAYTLLRNVLEASHGDQYAVELNVTVPGLASTKVGIAGGYGFQRSPFMSVSEAGNVILHSALTRIYVDGRLATAVPQLPSVRFPLYLELAPADAQIVRVECDRENSSNGVDVEVRPSLGQIAIANVDVAQFDNLSVAPTLLDGVIVNSAAFSVTAFANASLGGAQVQTLHFSIEEIEQGARKEAGTVDLAQGTTQSLLDDAQFEVKTIGLTLGLSTSTVSAATRTALAGVTSQIDNLYGQISNIAGVKVGVAEVGINRLRCGSPMLVG
ncbi:TadG family pilus assembly protein [Tsuneonella sp. HG222]